MQNSSWQTLSPTTRRSLRDTNQETWGKKKHESSASTSSVQRGDSEGGDRCHQLEINMVEPDGVGRGGLLRRTAAFIAVG